MHWLNILILSLALGGVVTQLLGARLEHRPCKAVKYTYALSLSIAAVFVILMEVIQESEYGYAMALIVVLFQVLVGAVARFIHLKRKPKEYLDCEH